MWERTLNALMIIVIGLVLFGALYLQLFEYEQPCALCLLQRLGMFGVAAGALMNVKFGPRNIHYGVSLCSAVFGAYIALRQIALHACPDFPKFGVPFWGLSLYTWSFIIFACSVFSIAILLILFDGKRDILSKLPSFYWYFVAFFIFLAALINMILTFWQCGFSTC